MSQLRRITLLTDFGTADGYAAAMKGVIATIAPHAVVDDAAHDIAPGDVAAAAWALAGYWRYYPTGTVHIAVVDPAVGSARRALAASLDDRLFVAPDNGVLSRVLDGAQHARVVVITNPGFSSDDVSATFHGRDIFAPVAAHLASGIPLDEMGRSVDDAVRLELPVPQQYDDVLYGAVVHIDRFGNLITNIPADRVGARARVRIAGRDLQLLRTYADAGSGEPLALIGSRGLLEIAVRNGNAARMLDVQRLAEVTVGRTLS